MTDRDPAVAEALERTRPRATEGADWDDVVRRTAGAPQPAPRRPLVRALRWAPGLAGGVAIAAVLGVMVVRSGDAPPSAAPTGVTGVEALVRVTSTREGQTDEQAAERMEQVLTERARIQGIAGFRTERSGTGLSVFVPRTQDPGWVRNWVPAVPGLWIVDERAPGSASSADAARVLGAEGVRATPGDVAVFYAVLRAPGPEDDIVAGPYASRTEAESASARMTRFGRSGRVMAVRASVLIDRSGDGGRIVYRAYRTSLLSPGAITAVRTTRTGLVLRVAAEERPAFGDAVSRSEGPPVLKGPLIGGRHPVTRWDPRTGEAEIPMPSVDARSIGYRNAGGQGAALNVVELAAPVGPEPVRLGRRTALPQLLSSIGQDPRDGVARLRPETFRRMVSVTSPQGIWWVWSAQTIDGWEAAGAVSRHSAGLGQCDVEPARPVITVCGGDWEHPRKTRVLFGRAADGVRRVTVISVDGLRTDARIANGFYIAAIPFRSGRLRAVVAVDGAGREMARITPTDPLYGSVLGGFFR